MRRFSDRNPIVLLVYFLATAGIAMFTMHPVLLSLSFLGALLYATLLGDGHSFKGHLFPLCLILGMGLLNPLFYHNGQTVLFVLNHNPITLEALLYGLVAGFMGAGVLYWFRCFSKIMTSDRLLYLFGSLSPKTALILSMALRYVPLFKKQWQSIVQSQKGLGLYKEETVLDSLQGNVRVFSILVTWALENGITTADSMVARGYGTGRRSFFSLYRFTKEDGLYLACILLLSGCTLFAMGQGCLAMVYYPALSLSPMGLWGTMGVCCYGLLCLLPVVNDVLEDLQWKFLASKI